MAAPTVHHWRHGWIPLDATAEAEKHHKQPALDTSYRMQHRAPGPQDDTAAPMHDLGRMLPEDIYDPRVQLRYYGTGMDEADRQSFAKVNAAKGRPGKVMHIYRAAPKGVNKINPGDWVTPSQLYARQHNVSNLNGQGHVISKIVPAKELWTNGDSINEWGWYPSA